MDSYSIGSYAVHFDGGQFQMLGFKVLLETYFEHHFIPVGEKIMY